MNVNYLKLGIIALVVVCMTILLALHSVTETTAIAVIGPLVGYLVGNGVAAKSGVPVQPVISQRKEQIFVAAPADVHVVERKDDA